MSTSTKTPTRELVLTLITTLGKIYADEENPDALPDWSSIEPAEIMEFCHAWKELTQPYYGNAKDCLMQEMNSDEATEWPQGDYTATIKDVVEYNDLVLTMLFEHGLKDELFAKGAIQEVPATFKWNANKVRPFAKRSGPLAEIIKNARGIKSRWLSISRRE